MVCCGRVQLEFNVPVLRPRGQQEDLRPSVCSSMDLKLLHQHAAVVLVRRPVVVRSPEGGKPLALIVASGAADEALARVVCQPEVSHEDMVLAPAAVAAVPAMLQGRQGPVGIGPVEGEEPEREDGVEFRVLDVAACGEGLSRRERLLAVDLAQRDRRQLGVEALRELRGRQPA